MNEKYNYLTPESINHFIDTAFAEDVGDGDHSSLSAIPAETTRKARLIIKDEGIIAGLALAKMIFKRADANLQVNLLLNDGDTVKFGDIGLIVEGSARSILTAERLVLNCMQRMSGIATAAKQAVEQTKGTTTKILDTRKTTPNCRLIEKWAVQIGGAVNHRFGLFDMIMLKDNHVDYAGGVQNAIESAKVYRDRYYAKTGKHLRIEVETRNLGEVQEALNTGGVDVIMLDNMDIPTTKSAVALIKDSFKNGKNSCEIEASGGITLEKIAEIAVCGVDYISIGALTHSVKSLDISLKAY
jgi:nicotinate-nucleotide pyrophosphorylase (carboxylating)